MLNSGVQLSRSTLLNDMTRSDLLQRTARHPAKEDVAERTPRLWKQRIAANRLRLDVIGHA